MCNDYSYLLSLKINLFLAFYYVYIFVNLSKIINSLLTYSVVGIASIVYILSPKHLSVDLLLSLLFY